MVPQGLGEDLCTFARPREHPSFEKRDGARNRRERKNAAQEQEQLCFQAEPIQHGTAIPIMKSIDRTIIAVAISTQEQASSAPQFVAVPSSFSTVAMSSRLSNGLGI